MPREYRLFLRTVTSVFLFFISLAIQGQGFTPIRVNCGGPQYVDSQGVVWAADYGYHLAASTDFTTANITGTLSPGLYQTERYGNTILYMFSAPNGTYTVNLRFAEIHRTTAGQRLFSIAINHQWVLGNFDIIAQSGGPNRALDKAFTVAVTSGVVIIQLTASVDNAVISGIEILSQTSPAQVTGNPGGSTPPTGGTTSNPPPTGGTTGTVLPTVNQTGSAVARISCGGAQQYTDPQGVVWAADYGYWGVSGAAATAATIAGTTSQSLYQNERWGASFGYKVPVPNGTYKVNLKFAENYWTTAGKRLFQVSINGQWVLANFDILAQAGGPNKALDKAFSIAVTTGAIIIQFTAVVDYAKINAIEILPQVTTTSIVPQPPIQTTQPPIQPIVNPVQVSLTPSFATLNAGGKSQFNAAVTGASNSAVQWSITPPIGTISSSGLYGAPSTISSAQTVTVLATSLADPSKTASAAISLVPTVPSLPPTPPPVTSVSPNQTSLTSSQAQQFAVTGLPSAMTTGGTPTTVSWSLNPTVGSITQNGLYTAPNSISAQQRVAVLAKDAATAAILGTATVTLMPPAAPPPAPPSGLTATAGNAQVSLSWTASAGATSYNVKRATVSGGPYAPVGSGVTTTGFVNSGLTNGTTYYYVVSAVNASGEGPLSIEASAQLAAPPPAPTGLTTTEGNGQVTLSWTASPGATSYNVKLGTTSGGPYTTVGSATTTSYVITGLNNGTTYYYVVSALNASGESPDSAQVNGHPAAPPVSPAGLTATAGNAQVTLSWTASSGATSYNVKRATVSGGPYTTVGSGVTTTSFANTGLTNGTTYYYVVSALNANGESPNSGQVNGQPTAPPAAPTTIQLPLEVIGLDGTTVTVSLPIPAGTSLSGQLQLWMQIHGLRYETQASVNVNNTGWMPINSSSVNLLGLASAYGGIGGGFSTLKMLMNVPAGVVTTGNNSVSFRFNGTDGRVSGFRVLALNIQNSGGSLLVPASTFVNDDPSTWQPPSTNASDVSAGQTLWHQAALTVPTSSGAQPIQARCADCHAQDGRDLKYFNYSNNSIRARSMFHGLTAQQGDQIASYIRSLNVPNPGRPWNPPYQPGPGMDSKPVSQWSAGAGIDAVLDTDAAMQPYLMPGGSTAGWAANQYLNVRELPIALQLPDWNTWLPAIHPMDAFGAAFTSNTFNSLYGTLRTQLHANDPAAYGQALQYFDFWNTAQINFLGPMEGVAMSSSWTPTLRTQVYAAAVWQMVKLWELNQEFGLEAMPQAIFGAKANPRGWNGNNAFNTSPNMLHMSDGPGLGNGSRITKTYLAYIWYHLQLILNDGQGKQADHNPIDYPYVHGFVRGLNWGNNVNFPGDTPEAMLAMVWYVKDLQELTLTGKGPEFGANGWHAFSTTPYNLIDSAWSGIWSATSPSTRAALMQGYLQAWFAQASQYTPQQYYQGGWANAGDNPAVLNPFTNPLGWGGQLWDLLPWFRTYGVDADLTHQVADWAAKIWPSGNWALNKAGTCVPGGRCTSDAVH